MEQVKKTCKVILPYVKAGRKYFIETHYINEDEREGLASIDWRSKALKAECVHYLNFDV